MNTCLENLLDKAHEQKSPKEIVALSPEALEGVSEKGAEALKTALGVKTIADLATNKYVLWAQALNTLAQAQK